MSRLFDPVEQQNLLDAALEENDTRRIPLPQGEVVAQIMEIKFAGGESTMTTVNNGLYRVFKRVTGGCVEFDFFARPRLVTDSPFAHFRVDDLWYYSHYDQRDAIPGRSMYVNGGRTYLT